MMYARAIQTLTLVFALSIAFGMFHSTWPYSLIRRTD